MSDFCERARWERMLRADEANLAYFARRTTLPGVSLFRCDREDVSEFDIAMIYRVPEVAATATLLAIDRHFRACGKPPRVRLSPLSGPGDWQRGLSEAGYRDAEEPLDFFQAPDTVHLIANPDVRVRRVISAGDCEQFAAIQVAGFGLPGDLLAWERSLAREGIFAGRYALHLAWSGGQVVGGSRSVFTDGVTALAALTTLPEERGRGVGTSLLARMIEDGRARRSELVFGAVVPGSPAAVLYRKLGFVTRFTTRTFIQEN